MDKNFIFLLILLVILSIIFCNSSKILSENFENITDDNVSLKVDEVFKKNFDLDYYDIRDPAQISELKKIFTNKLAPIINQNVGRTEQGMASVKDVPSELTNRVPDNLSNNDEYKIPMPKFDDLQENIIKPLQKSFSELQNLKKSKKEIKNFPEIKIPQKPVVQEEVNFTNYKKNIEKCHFVRSIDGTNKCTKEYPNYTGASFSSIGTNLNCSGDDIPIKRAQALAIIKNGSVVDVIITESGDFYSENPKVYVRGIGKNAVLKSEIKNNKVSKISVVNGGINYHSTPTIIIEKPNTIINCNLCCKN